MNPRGADKLILDLQWFFFPNTFLRDQPSKLTIDLNPFFIYIFWCV